MLELIPLNYRDDLYLVWEEISKVIFYMNRSEQENFIFDTTVLIKKTGLNFQAINKCMHIFQAENAVEIITVQSNSNRFVLKKGPRFYDMRKEIGYDNIMSPIPLLSSTQVIDGSKDRATYDISSCKLHFLGEHIQIPANSNQDALCRIIFKNKDSRKKQWSTDEILHRWGGNYFQPDSWRKVYNAAREVNKKVAMYTKVKNLLTVKKYSVELNPQYR